MKDMNEFLQMEEKIVKILKTVYDPEIPVDIYELGLILQYRCERW
jgi:metal-sulfur cluster biosynthetic enzyme